MSSLIFFIFMIWFIMRIVKNKQKATGQNDPKQTQGSNTPGSAATRTGSTYSTAAGRAKKSAYESAMAFQKTATGSGAGSSPSRLGNSTFGSDGSSSSSLLPQRRIWNGKRRRMPGIMRRKSARNRRVSIRKPADVWSACGIMSGTAFRRETGLSSAAIAVQRYLISERYKPNRYTCYFCREILE